MNYNELLLKRFACKSYSSQLLTKEEELSILEYGRLTPSSFGLEAWHIYSLSKRTSPEFFDKMFTCCFNQYSVKSAAFITVLTYFKEASFKSDSDFIKSRAERFDGGLKAFEEDFRGFYSLIPNVNSWSKAQTYLMGMNMAIGASSIGIESCILEGFNEEAAAKVLNLDLSQEGIGLVIPFGYPAEGQKGKLRIKLEELVTQL